ncbi:MAG: YbaB/EbfC family nucleoid-associated protein [Bacillota bacterium]|jgi:DNA-binding YbaB/EbfC family protein|nr:YbaB/EbfC family nucleoid-associated protein [Bacillota bacterium]HOB43995.1 YbaB/EbfC family nucleoid-associated protein [Bacillota bacterium]HOO31296.1 YbaB/EbfC family nucleoid-associated protein [Bacillota bacterium]HPZ14799.1 YbaB/EbfC family nucleoid-associated protein [Bacillota bacterium]HQD81356.1 YbaB/EbfC family nucleoid-associated protein [Bacillota bacterium]
MGGNMKKMMKQVQKMQEDMERVQQELAEERIETTAGGGVVRAVVNGHQEVLEIHIDPAVVDPDDVDMLEDLVVAACNEALRKAKELAEQRLAKVTGNISIPGLNF